MSAMNWRSKEEEEEEVKYRGVRKRKWGKWVSEIRLPNSRERIWLGSYDSAEKAARAFDAALFCLRGSSANFNFPHQPPNIPGGTDLHPSQIQAVAAHYANSHPLSSSSSSSSSTSQHDHHTSMDHVIVSSSQYHLDSSLLMDDEDALNNNSNIYNNIPDFGIFPGFDDYFMPVDHPPLTLDYKEDHVYDHGDPSFLWNF